MSSTTLDAETFSAQDGNHNRLDDARYPAPGEATDYLLDVDGNELRAGDFALVLPTYDSWPKYVGKVVKVESVRRASLLGGGVHRYLITEDGRSAWSPSSPVNGVNFSWRRSSTGGSPQHFRKMNLTAEAHKRLMLMELLDERAALDVQAATIEGERVRTSALIRNLRVELGEE